MNPPEGQGQGEPGAQGLRLIIQACQRLYPQQPNPLQVTAVVKYWLGGPDPLDYISMFANPGTADSAPHWHYVSCGLTDLHGDARVHPPATSPEAASGYGFELTFRLRREPNQNQPPTWPAALLNSIAKYVFESENKLVAGDHINWSKPLDRGTSTLRHLLVAKDPQLEQFSTGLGTVRFLQLIGVSEEELKSVQRWNGEGITELLRASPPTGGSLLVTDPARQSIFEMRPEARELVEAGIAKDGSNLCGMAALIDWIEPESTEERQPTPPGQALYNWESLAKQCDRLAADGQSSPGVSYPRSVALACSLHTATVLPLCIQGRLRHGFHFTLKSIVKETAVTFVTEKVAGTLVSPDRPFAAQGDWLQVLLPESFLEEFHSAVFSLEGGGETLPRTFTWPHQRLQLTVCREEGELSNSLQTKPVYA